ncbi:phytosulfokines 1-like [Phragmites australis]|uniref:phytosulfokines 1-like n=1 Tax=Phragmites australis TaxID=29695 RepID=UPI002D7A035A|nr:phytosulfokines 1-like [Phragmites australis]
MMHAGRRAMALVCLLFLALLLVQDVQSRKLLWTVQEKQSHDSFGSHGTGTPTSAAEPCSGGGGSTGSADEGQAHCDTAKWAELHTDYIYTQDVKHP